MLEKHAIFPFSSINYMFSVNYIFLLNITCFCNFYMFGFSSASLLMLICHSIMLLRASNEMRTDCIVTWWRIPVNFILHSKWRSDTYLETLIITFKNVSHMAIKQNILGYYLFDLWGHCNPHTKKSLSCEGFYDITPRLVAIHLFVFLLYMILFKNSFSSIQVPIVQSLFVTVMWN